MNRQRDEDIPYRNDLAGIVSTPVDSVSAVDEKNYDSLKSVLTDFEFSMESLYRDFNSFELLKAGTTAAARDTILRQIEARQVAYDILAPLLQKLQSAINVVDTKYRED